VVDPSVGTSFEPFDLCPKSGRTSPERSSAAPTCSPSPRSRRGPLCGSHLAKTGRCPEFPAIAWAASI